MFNKGEISILIVEDNVTCTFLYEALFSSYSAKTTYVKSGEEAWELFQKEEFNLVIMDVILPGVNGIDTAYTLRTINPDIPVLFVTASALSFVNDEFTNFDNFGVLDKPISGERFFNSVEHLLERSSIAS